MDSKNITNCSDNSSNDSEKYIKFVEPNKLFLYCDNLDILTALQLNSAIIDLNNQIINDNNEKNKKKIKHIDLHINCYGGNIDSAISILNTIKASTLPINTIIDSVCASAATLISLAGKNRYAYRNSSVLIHQPSKYISGDYKYFSDVWYNFQQKYNWILNYYLENTKMTKELVEDIIENEKYLNAKECLECGIIDKII